MSDKVYLGRAMGQLDTSPALAPVSKVVLLVDDDTAYIAGDETGRTVELTCPYGSQDMASNLLASLRSYSYRPLQAQEALLDPAAELGDGLTAGGVYTVLAQADWTFDALMTCDGGAPGKTEQDSEYQYQSPTLSGIQYQIANTRSQITKTAEEINLKVEGVSKELSGQIAEVSIKLDSITLSVSNGSTSSTIQLKAGEVVIASQTIQMNGLVTFTGLANGTTTIDGACIKTGTIDAERVNLTGAISFDDLSSGVQSDIKSIRSKAENAEVLASRAQSAADATAGVVDSWTYGGTTYIDGSMLMTNTVRASTLEGGSVNLLNSAGTDVGVLTMTGASTATFAVDLTSHGALRLTAEEGDLYAESGRGTYLQVSGTVVAGNGDFSSNQNGLYSCGRSGYRWSEVYAATSEITTSDRRLKNTITYDMSPYDKLFDLLRPTPYRYNDGRSGRTHTGMIAQDVEQALTDLGMTTLDFAGLVKGEDGEGGKVYSLRYEEFIALCIDQLQRLKQRVKDLEGRV